MTTLQTANDGFFERRNEVTQPIIFGDLLPTKEEEMKKEKKHQQACVSEAFVLNHLLKNRNECLLQNKSVNFNVHYTSYYVNLFYFLFRRLYNLTLQIDLINADVGM